MKRYVLLALAAGLALNALTRRAKPAPVATTPWQV